MAVHIVNFGGKINTDGLTTEDLLLDFVKKHPALDSYLANTQLRIVRSSLKEVYRVLSRLPLLITDRKKSIVSK